MLPPNWDSWGKIRVLREGFDVEGVNRGWSIDIEDLTPQINGNNTHTSEDEAAKGVDLGGALAVYEDTIRDPTVDSRPAPNANSTSNGLDVQSVGGQAFLATQFEVLERIRHNTEPTGPDSRREMPDRKTSQSGVETPEESGLIEEGRVNEHIGPVQFNMGGIQVDADDMLQRLKVCIPKPPPTYQGLHIYLLKQDRQSHQTPDPDTPGVASPDGKSQNEALASFFAGLMKRGGGSTTSSPKPGAS